MASVVDMVKLYRHNSVVEALNDATVVDISMGYEAIRAQRQPLSKSRGDGQCPQTRDPDPMV